MNLDKFQILLQEAIDNSSTTTDYLLLSKAIQTLNVGQVREVATYADLPSAASNEGLLVFVTADERVYWSTGQGWYNLVTENEGFVWSWGWNNSGQLGDNTTVDKSSPVSVVGGFTDWCQVSAGASHNLGVRTNGTAWAWGDNNKGQLGNNDIVAKSSPVLVLGGFTDWCQVSASGSDLCFVGNRPHSLGLRINGTAWAWGGNESGQLGDGTTVSKSLPVLVVGGFADWRQVSASNNFSVGLRTNGTIWSWGCAADGVLGDNTTVSKSSPVSVVGGFTDWCQVSASSYHTLGLRTNGTVWAWGWNNSGRLGDGTIVDKSSPVSVIGGFNDWCQVSAGASHSLGLRNNGTAWAWGSSFQGQLGSGNTTDRSSPVSVVGGFTDWCQVFAGGGIATSGGVRTNGTAWTWGWNGCGQIGDNSISRRTSPVSVVGGFADWCQISVGGIHTIAIRKTNFV